MRDERLDIGDLSRNIGVAVLKNNLVDALLATVPDLEVPQAVVRDEAAGMAAQITPQGAV